MQNSIYHNGFFAELTSDQALIYRGVEVSPIHCIHVETIDEARQIAIEYIDELAAHHPEDRAAEYYVDPKGYNLHVAVNPSADLNDRVTVLCLDTHQLLNVEGWMHVWTPAEAEA